MTADIFDWASIRSNLISEALFFLLTLITIPAITLYVIKWKNRKFLVLKFSHILLEFCDFLSYTNYRDKELNSEHINIFTKRSNIKEYKFVAISIINVFSPIVYPKILLVIHEVHNKGSVEDSYLILKNELSRLKELRIEIEQVLSAHSLHLDEKTLLKISRLCFQIRKLELTHKNNESFDELSRSTGSDMTGVFGVAEIVEIYKSIFNLIKDILDQNYFDFSVEKKK